jgi:hypothetical protein
MKAIPVAAEIDAAAADVPAAKVDVAVVGLVAACRARRRAFTARAVTGPAVVGTYLNLSRSPLCRDCGSYAGSAARNESCWPGSKGSIGR